MKNIRIFHLENFPFLVVKFSIYLNRRVFVMLKSASAFAQSDQSLLCPHEETLHLSLSKIRPGKTLIRLREDAGCSETSLGAHVRGYIS